MTEQEPALEQPLAPGEPPLPAVAQGLAPSDEGPDRGAELGIALVPVILSIGTILVLLDADSPSWLVSFLLLVIGIGVGVATAVLPVAVLNAVPANEYGIAPTCFGLTIPRLPVITL